MKNFKLIFTLTAVSFFSACGNGRVTVAHQVNFGVEVGLHLVQGAANDRERDNAVQRIRDEASITFPWEVFWNEVRTRNLIQNYQGEQRQKLFALHRISCKSEHFRSFANLVITNDSDLDFLATPKRGCESSIGPALIAQMVSRLSNRDTDGDQVVLVTGILTAEYSRDRFADWQPVLNLLTPKRWEEIAKLLAETDHGSQILIGLIDTHQEVLGHSEFTRALTSRIIREAQAYSFSKKRMGTDRLLRLMESAQSDVFDGLDESKSAELLDRFIKLVKDAPNAGEAWTVLNRVRALEERLQDRYSVLTAVKWLQGLHLAMELKLLGDHESSSAELPNDSFDGLWLKIRFNKRGLLDKPASDLAPNSERVAHSRRLNRILGMRVKTLLSSDLHQALGSYCKSLSAEGISNRSIDWSQIPALIQSRSISPGCLTSLPSNKDELALQTSRLEMSDDSALILPGAHLNLKTGSLLASIIDLTETQEFEPLPKEPVDEVVDARAAPLLVGIKLDSNLIRTGKGIYYFVLHLVIRKASAGPAAIAQPQKGLAGGTLSLTLPEDGSQVLPSFVSLGGPGQKGVPRRRGGNEDVSKVDPSRMKSWKLAAAAQKFEPGSQAFFLPQPSASVLKKMLSEGEKNENGEIKLYVDEGLSYLDNSQVEKIKQGCKANEYSAFSMSDCLKAMALHAAKELGQDLAKLPEESNYSVLPKLATYEYRESSADQGAINPDGPNGPDGKMEINP